MTKTAEHLPRKTAKTLDRILGKQLKVLDDGFVRVVDYMGNDESIVQAARVSYGAGTKTKQSDRQLIRYLMRHLHTSPFEMCEIKLHVRVPMDCWRQWIRHRTANVNEYSTRYSIAIDAAYQTKPDAWRMQALNNKQGSEGFLDKTKGKVFTANEKKLQQMCYAEYNKRIEAGIARELARKDLPLATYTEAYWKIDLHNLLHFLLLRLDSKAQYEIREYSRVIGEQIVSRWCPFTWEAFEDYWQNSISLSSADQKMISALQKNNKKEALAEAEKLELVKTTDGKVKPTLEGLELEVKLKALQLTVPWR
ncbi:MAG: FAD-dependent thymidylate synthase [Candidatus Margulisbacteria bacterium]|nr:FAD-dependent thymidylate synthase [Candidatus Margulisiibacteriota bacterium]